MTGHKKAFTQGFTLVELSIVIIIVGFLIAGIAAGKNLIKQAQLNSVIAEYNSFTSAIATFKERFNFAPGDLPTASAYWPTCDATPSNCNGNGNGMIEYGSNYQFNTNQEPARFWQHLSLSGIVPQRYRPVLDGSNNPIIGTTVPATSYQSVDGQPAYWTISGWDGSLIMSARNPIAGPYDPDLDVFAPADGYNIDLKIDDGIGNTGNVEAGVPKMAIWGGFPWSGSCRTDYDGSNWTVPTPAGPVWQINNDGYGCILIMKIGGVTGDPR